MIVGDVDLDLPRPIYYGKELDLRLSRSYGPGDYDSEYEERGLDYPIGYVRWTERMNMGEVLRLAHAGSISRDRLITRTVPIERAEEVFDEIMSGERSPLGVAFTYDQTVLLTSKPRPIPGHPPGHSTGSPSA